MHLSSLVSLGWIAHSVSGKSFVPPFEQESWQLSGDARSTDKMVDLVSKPKQAGAVWAKEPVAFREFTLEADIRSVPDLNTEVGKSGFSIWYTKEKPSDTGYAHGAADTWDGLAIMIDSLGAEGAVRGHLNDGSIKFSSLKDLDTESLSLCRLKYRGAASALTVRIGYSETKGFAVDIMGQKCLISKEIKLPQGYYFGISADSDVSGDTLSVERLEIVPGMKDELVAHLPQPESEADAAKGAAKAEPKAEQQTEQNAEQKAEQKAEPRDPKGQLRAKPADAAADTYQESTPAVTRDEVARLLDPISSRVELMEVKLTQVQSSVEQLVNTISLSMSQITESGQKGGSGPDSADLSALQKEVQSLRTQISDWRKSSGTTASPGPAPASGSSSLWVIITVVLPIQLVAVALYHSWLRRKERHEKLL